MNRKQSSRLDMYHAVQDFCTINNATWNNFPAFKDAFQDFSTALIGIHPAIKVQQEVRLGFQKLKAQSKENMLVACLDLCNAVYAYAVKSNNAVLKARMKFSHSSLSKGSVHAVAGRVQGLKDEILKHVDQLKDFKVTKSDLTKLQQLIDLFETTIASPRLATTEQKKATADIFQLDTLLSLILRERMDPLLSSIQAEESDFVENYFNARIIVDRGPSKRVVKEEDAETESKVEEVPFGLDETMESESGNESEVGKSLDSEDEAA